MGFIPPLVAGISAAAGAASGAVGGLSTALGAASAIKGLASSPKLPPPPAAPALSSLIRPQPLIGPYEGSANGTLISGTNQRSSSSGASKTLLGQ